MEAATDRPLLRTGELSRRVGVSDPLLRAWESRYRLPQPARLMAGDPVTEAEQARWSR
jgi:MerR family transcriptional regulator, light-induced transcriptional regulator